MPIVNIKVFEYIYNKLELYASYNSQLLFSYMHNDSQDTGFY